MKKVILAALLCAVYGIASVNTTVCKGCHGQNFEKKALGKSHVVADMNATSIETALIGYKNGTYGGSFKGIMKGQVSKYSDDELKAAAKTLVK